METTEKKALVWSHLWLWLFLFGSGLLLGHWILEPMTEPVAVRWLYPRIPPSAESHIVRFVDLQPLYERDASEDTGGRLPASSFQKFLEAVKRLDKQHRPAAIGFDIPLFEEALPGQGGGVKLTTDREALLKMIIKFAESNDILIRIGTPHFRMNLKGMQKDFPKLSDFLSSTLVYPDAAVAPLWFGSGDKEETLGVLGFSVAADFVKNEKFEPGRSALESRHFIQAPKDWPAALQAAKWVYVDYSLLRQREELTVHVNATETENKHEGGSKLFSAKDLQRLEHRDNRGTLWIVGVAEVPEIEDVIVYDEHSQWLGEGEPIRRMYQHGAIANTYLNSPLTFVPPLFAKAIDLVISLSGLLAVLLLEGLLNNDPQDSEAKKVFKKMLRAWGWLALALPYYAVKHSLRLRDHLRRKLKKKGDTHPANTGTKHEDASEGVIRIGISMGLFALAFLVSWGLAIGFHLFWFGFVGTACYALFEPMAAHILHPHS